MCPPDVQNRVFTSKGARYAARTSRENPKLGRSSSPTMFNILLSNCCPHLGTALAPPQHYAVHCCLCTLCTHYIAACVNCGYSELYQQLLSCPVQLLAGNDSTTTLHVYIVACYIAACVNGVLITVYSLILHTPDNERCSYLLRKGSCCPIWAYSHASIMYLVHNYVYTIGVSSFNAKNIVHQQDTLDSLLQYSILLLLYYGLISHDQKVGL